MAFFRSDGSRVGQPQQQQQQQYQRPYSPPQRQQQQQQAFKTDGQFVYGDPSDIVNEEILETDECTFENMLKEAIESSYEAAESFKTKMYFEKCKAENERRMENIENGISACDKHGKPVGFRRS